MAVKRAAKATAKKRVIPKETEYCVYIGPSINGVVNHGAIFHGTVEDACKKLAPHLERTPRIRSLIVSGDDLSEARLKIKTPGNGLYEQRNRLLKDLSGGK